MIRLLNKRAFIGVFVVFLSLSIMSGCSSNKKASVNKASTTNKQSVSNKNQTDENTGNTDDTDNTTSGESGTKGNQKSEDKHESSSNATKQDQTYNLQKELLSKTKELAVNGKVINCSYAAMNSNISSVEEEWGKEDKSDWVKNAKGIYITYEKHNIVFGINKGEQIFEVRSFDESLSKITMSGVKKYYGTPPHYVKTNGEEILGYTISKNFKILFVFSQKKNSTDDPVLKHYSILYPQGTVNYMSGDMGREW